MKSNIQTSNLGLDFINALKPVVYERINDERKITEYGFIAQEVEATLKQFGATNNGLITIDDEGMYSLRYNDFISISVKALQEQEEVIKSLQSTVESLQSTVGSQQSLIEGRDSKIEELTAELNELKTLDKRMQQIETKLKTLNQ